jgi:hypothetical protein
MADGGVGQMTITTQCRNELVGMILTPCHSRASSWQSCDFHQLEAGYTSLVLFFNTVYVARVTISTLYTVQEKYKEKFES